MKREVSPQEALIEALLRAQRPLSLDELAVAVGRTKPPTFQALQALVEDGRVQRLGARPSIQYALRPSFRADWVFAVPWANDQVPTWTRAAWQHPAEIDWRFPLVSRVRDEEGRRVLLELLRTAWATGLFTPWLLPPPAAHTASAWTRPENHARLTFVVFGSCARGDARKDSDLDLFVLVRPPGPAPGMPVVDYEEALRDITEPIDLQSGRQVQLVVAEQNAKSKLPDKLPVLLQKSIVTDGVTVFTTEEDASTFIEPWRAHMKDWLESMRG